MSTLYLVPTPIGNLSDITYRAIETLKNVDVIAAEDTRNTQNLLNKYDIKAKKLISMHSYNEINSMAGIIKLLDEGKNVAIVSDAGTPCISDPGARVVEKVKGTNHSIVPLPGASACTTLVCASGNIGKTWIFEGFLPRSAGKLKKRLEELLNLNLAFVIYESPFRILKLLECIIALDSTRIITLARELTKIHEEILSLNVTELYEILKERKAIKGEIALLVHPKSIKKDDFYELSE